MIASRHPSRKKRTGRPDRQASGLPPGRVFATSCNLDAGTVEITTDAAVSVAEDFEVRTWNAVPLTPLGTAVIAALVSPERVVELDNQSPALVAGNLIELVDPRGNIRGANGETIQPTMIAVVGA